MTERSRGPGVEGAISLGAVDLGASSGRVILGRVGPGTLKMQEVRRFRNGPVTLPDGLYWDILGLYQDIITGLRDAVKEDPDIRGVAIDSWAVDYGLVDAAGRLIGNPRHYRDDRTAPVIDKVHAAAPAEKLYAINGLQFLPFNTLYQFVAEPHVHEPGVQALLIPDLLGYWLTGQRVTEATNASTTGLLDARSGLWSAELFDVLGLPAGLLPPVVAPGTLVGALDPEVQAATGLAAGVTVSTVGSHDTASAVVGIPAATENFAYISCGTWGLVGVELDAPVLTEESRAANFTNERGVDGTIRYLRNVMGLWLLSETLRTWDLRGGGAGLTELLAQAAEIPAGGPRFDPDDPVFLPPGDMPGRIAQVLAAAGEQVVLSPAGIVRCILDSLATTFAARVADAARLSGRSVDVIHIVGGGSQNTLLCQLVADAAGLPVIAGPVEATALGNLLVQARTHGVLNGDLWSLREMLIRVASTTTYQPRLNRFQ
jgi:rhamnulokinase